MKIGIKEFKDSWMWKRSQKRCRFLGRRYFGGVIHGFALGGVTALAIASAYSNAYRFLSFPCLILILIGHMVVGKLQDKEKDD